MSALKMSKTCRKLLKPLPAATAPQNNPAAAAEMMTEKLGDPPSVWKIDWKDLEIKVKFIYLY